MSLATADRSRSAIPVAIVAGSLVALTIGVASGVSTRAVVGVVFLATAATLVRAEFIAWPHAIAAMIVIILMIPIRRFSFPGNLPFQLEPYRVYVALLVLGWVAALLVDPRIRLRRTGFEGPLIVIVGSSLVSIVANPVRVSQSPEVAKSLMFFLSFVLVLYVIVSVIRRLDSVDFVAKTLVVGGAILAGFAIVEARTGYNVFNHIDHVMPFLRPQAIVEPGGFLRYGSGTLRVFGSAQHPIALSAALVMLMPLAIYLAQRYRQRRWILCAIALVVACAATVSRTGIIMLIVVGVVFLILRPRETVRLWPALLIALIVIKVAMPGTLGAIRHSFFPPGGLIAEQEVQPGTIGSGRLADLGPALGVWAHNQPLTGQGFGTNIRIHPNDPNAPPADILDDQWLGTLLATGALGLFGWLWFFVRAVRRFGREARLDASDRGRLLVALTAGIAAFAAGMITYDAFSFIQITFLLFIFIGLGSALTGERPIRLAVQARRAELDGVKAVSATGLPSAVPVSLPADVPALPPAVRMNLPADSPADVLLVCSSGGHLMQMLALRPAWGSYSHVWVTFDKSDARSLLRDEHVVYAHSPTNRSVKNLLRNTLVAWRTLGAVRPGVLLTTGAGVAVPFAWVARLRRVPVVYIESFTRIERPSLSCRLIAPIADRVYAQWPELTSAVPKARYAGNVFTPS